MKGFVEIAEADQILVFGGKDSDVARFMEALGYGIGALVRAIKLLLQNRQNVTEFQAEILRMYAR